MAEEEASLVLLFKHHEEEEDDDGNDRRLFATAKKVKSNCGSLRFIIRSFAARGLLIRRCSLYEEDDPVCHQRGLFLFSFYATNPDEYHSVLAIKREEGGGQK